MAAEVQNNPKCKLQKGRQKKNWQQKGNKEIPVN